MLLIVGQMTVFNHLISFWICAHQSILSNNSFKCLIQLLLRCMCVCVCVRSRKVFVFNEKKKGRAINIEDINIVTIEKQYRTAPTHDRARFGIYRFSRLNYIRLSSYHTTNRSNTRCVSIHRRQILYSTCYLCTKNYRKINLTSNRISA